MQLISELLSSAAKAHHDREAIIFENSTLTYGELNENVNNLAKGLQRLGIRRGDRVMVQLANGPEIIMAHYAVIKAGAIAVPLNVMYVAHEIIYIGRDTGARAVITDSQFYLRLQKDYAQLPDLKHIILADDAVAEGCHRLQDLIADSTQQFDHLEAGYDDIVSIIYTSGTTGRPKGATQTHRSILSNVSSLGDFNKFSQENRLLCALPLFNNFALNVVMMSAFYLAVPLVLVDRFDAQKVLEHITEHRATYFAGTPTMYVYLLQAYDPQKHDVTAMRVVNSGGAHCPATLIKEVEKVLYTHPAVALAAVIGISDEIKGELAKAYIVLKEGMQATEDELIEFVRSKIAKYKAPRMVEFVKSLPQCPTGKILKRELRANINHR